MCIRDSMEGPFISPAKKGAQAAENIMHCDYEYFSRLQKAANGLIKLVAVSYTHLDVYKRQPNRRTGHGHGFYPAAARPLPAMLRPAPAAQSSSHA